MCRPRLLALSLLFLGACSREGGAPETPPPAPASSAGRAIDEARLLLEQGQPEAALQALRAAPSSAEALYLQGVAWAKKAETAPLPTPPPAPSPLPRGYVPAPAPEWKAEETEALALLEQAVAADPGHPRAHKALADLLAPHALRRVEAARAATSGRPRGKRGAATAVPVQSAGDGPDASPERVVREYQAALAADPTSKEPVEALITFCERADRTADVESAFEELLKRERESPAPFVRYGDYLRSRRNFEGAVTQYRQALIWKADDEATRAKIGEIYVTLAEENLGRQEWAAADQRLKDAQKWIKDKNSPVGLKLQAAQAQLRQIRR